MDEKCMEWQEQNCNDVNYTLYWVSDTGLLSYRAPMVKLTLTLKFKAIVMDA